MVPGAPPAWGLSCPNIYSPVGTNSPARTPGAGSRFTGCVCPGDHEPAAGSGRRLAACGLGRESLAPEDSPGQGQRRPTRQLATRHSLPGKTGRPPQLSLFLAVASCRGDTSADTPTQGGPGWGFLPRNPLESRSCRAHPQLGFHQISREWGRKACGPPAPRVGQGDRADTVTRECVTFRPGGPSGSKERPTERGRHDKNGQGCPAPASAGRWGEEDPGPRGAGSQVLQPQQAHWGSARGRGPAAHPGFATCQVTPPPRMQLPSRRGEAKGTSGCHPTSAVHPSPHLGRRRYGGASEVAEGRGAALQSTGPAR